VAALPELVEFWRTGFRLDQCGVLLRREALAAIGGLDERLHYAMDYDLFLRLAERFPFKLVDDVLARFTLHPHSKTGRLGHTHLFIAERQRASQRYWGRPGSPAYRVRQRACRRHLCAHFAGAVVHVYQRHGVLDWGALGRLARHSPARLLNRHLLGVVAECCLGRRAAAALRAAFARRGNVHERHGSEPRP
jgi:GT2 family glycosyltransferase